ncbi:MAG: hypothetical protein COV45_07125 [Deltaproteobacteria bacterium CG11_big_fil_rev_8_21_14_0_20_47_16]|nr:MAG: hypothetical protein COV45_07125 [Deltaproteobacteria bacterium CG11_big_fil_rev_8_21_14_0_20_47_16]
MKRAWLIIVVLMLVTACSKVELYHNLGEDEVNEILVVLNDSGIHASKKEKIVQNESTWMIIVDKDDLERARKILVSHNLPHRKQPGIAEVYKEGGLIKTPDEQKAHFIIAIKGDLVNALRKDPDVVDADVVINIPDKEEFGSNDPAEKKHPSASLIIKIRPTPEAQANLTEAKLQRFVANAVPEMDPRDVTVITSYVGGNSNRTLPGQSPSVITPGMPSHSNVSTPSGPTVMVAGVEVSESSSNRLKIYLAVFLGLLALLSIALVITVIHTHRVRQESQRPSGTVDGQLMGPDDHKQLGPGE